MKARPGLNGNDPKDFRDAGIKLAEIAADAEQAIKDAACGVFHGRNYQHWSISAAQDARKSDIERLRDIVSALNDLEALGIELFEAGEQE